MAGASVSSIVGSCAVLFCCASTGFAFVPSVGIKSPTRYALPTIDIKPCNGMAALTHESRTLSEMRMSMRFGIGGRKNGRDGGAAVNAETSKQGQRTASTALYSAPVAGNMVMKTSIRAIAKLLASCAFGVGAKRAGVMDDSALKVCSKLIYNVFQPALLFVNVASTVARTATGASGGSMKLLLSIPVFATGQIILGMILGLLVTKTVLRGASDSSRRQVTMCTTFANSGPLPLLFVDAIFHNNPVMLQKAVAYISLYLLGWSPLFWTLGYNLLCPPVDNDGATKKNALQAAADKIISPPVLGSISGLIVGLVPFARNVLVSPEGLLFPVFEAMRTLGTAYLPLAIMVLAGSLFKTPAKAGAAAPASSAPAEKTSWQDALPTHVAAVMFSRFLLIPTATMALVKFVALRWPALAADPVLILVLLLQGSMPSAQNSTVILQLEGRTEQASRVAKLLLAVYLLSCPAIAALLGRAINFSGVLA